MSEELQAITTLLVSISVAAAFPLGALLSIYLPYPGRIKSDIAAISAGIFLGAIFLSLVDEARKEDAVPVFVIGFTMGAIVFSASNRLFKKRSEKQDLNGSANHISKENIGSATTVIVGTFLDSIPETLFIGIIIGLHLPELIPSVIALACGNLTATMEGAKRMYEEGKKKSEILKKWIYVFIPVAASGPIGFYLVGPLTHDQLFLISGFAAGALMAFVTEELVPQAYHKVEVHIGLSATAGFLFVLLIFQYI
ncbi:MAG TPA: hypothetical protein VE130_13400 [Nitrososphaeraceae archaeon]|jgi:ZIP family zinc transporter|nr:hypothetical protein [Nitrososphaeraceae archaeon]